MLKHTKQIRVCVIGFVITVVLALAFLFISIFLPQDAIEYHVRASLEIIDKEGNYNVIGDYEKSSTMDGHTDALILTAALMTNSKQPDSILTNPMCGSSDDGAGSLEAFLEQYPLDYSEPTWNYVRYWMGFRAPVRLLLTKLDYGQIRTYLGYGLFTLIALVACCIAKYTNLRTMFVFMLSIILVKPQVICNSLQFSCCFFMALSAMLLVPYIHKNKRWEVLFFLELGMITMYFDFYTSPTIVFGYPLVFLLVMDIIENEKIKYFRLVRNIVVWLVGYAMMWIAKLTFTTFFTSYNGLQNGLKAFSERVGINKLEGLEEYYSIPLAIKNVFDTVLPNREDKILCVVLLLLAIILIVILNNKKQISIKALKMYLPILIVAAIPFVWFGVAAEPTAIHAWFQYRNIALTYWAVGAFLCGIYNKAVA